MIDNGEQLDIHISRVATWAMNTIGRALVASTLMAALLGVIGAVMGDPVVLAAAGLAGVLTFAAVLYLADAPMPETFEDDQTA